MNQEDHDLQLEVLKKLRRAVDLNLRELQHAMSQRPLSSVAWIARNIVELTIWVEYCKSSPERAKRFYQDSERDSLDMLNIPSEECSGDQPFNFRAERARLLEKAKQDGDFENPEAPYLQVSKAAKEVGWQDEFVYTNKLLSKFAHPTALAVMDLLKCCLKSLPSS